MNVVDSTSTTNPGCTQPGLLWKTLCLLLDPLARAPHRRHHRDLRRSTPCTKTWYLWTRLDNKALPSCPSRSPSLLSTKEFNPVRSCCTPSLRSSSNTARSRCRRRCTDRKVFILPRLATRSDEIMHSVKKRIATSSGFFCCTNRNRIRPFRVPATSH